MKITLNYKNKKTGHMVIEPNDSETSKAFIQAMAQTDKIGTMFLHGFSRTRVEIVNDFLRLCEVVKLINESSYDRKITVDLTKDFSLQKLFDLHEHFEHLGHRKRSNDPTLNRASYEEIINLGCEMNGLIHKLEMGLNGGLFFQALFAKPNIVRIPLTESIINEAVTSYKNDHIYVGFGETGKNMGHIFDIKDIEVLHRKLVQPQRYILSEIFISFYNQVFKYDEYEKWCIENKADEYGYDYKNPIWYGKWEIGKVVEKTWGNINQFPIYDGVIYED